MLPRPLVIALAVLISTMWATNLIVGFLYPGRSDPALNAIFAIVVGAVFALQRRAPDKPTGPTDSVRKKLARLIEPDDTDSQSDDRGDQP